MSVTLANQRVSRWLADLDKALSARDVAAALALFDEECFWRDMVAFTWNIKTMEGKGEIADMLAATLARRQAAQLCASRARRARPTASPRRGFTFETKVAARQGHLRLKGDKCWTMLTTAKRAEGPRGEMPAAPATRASSTACTGTARPGWSARRRKRPSSGYTRQPYCLDHRRRPGRHGARRAAEAARRADHHRREERARRRQLAQALQVALPARSRSGTTTCPTCRSPITGRSSRPRTRSATGWRCTPR